jgi:RNA polymerase-binding transcription factor DksA
MNRDQFLARMHEYLIDSKTKLLREMTTQLQTGRDASRDDGTDSGDLAFEENEREVSIMLSEREGIRIGRIDDAIGRIAARKYGRNASH